MVTESRFGFLQTEIIKISLYTDQGLRFPH